MRNSVYITTLAALIGGSMSLVQAAPKLKTETAAAEGRTVLENVRSTAYSMVAVADRLAIDASRTGYADVQLKALNELRYHVNKIGHDLALLENEEASLPDWASKSVNEIVPLMREIAQNTEKAILNFDANRDRVWATGFSEQTARIYEGAVRVRDLLDSYLKLAGVREQEQRIAAKLNGNQ